MKKVYLSPSSQIHNAYTGMDTTECIQCNRIAEAAEAALKRCGVEVKRAPFDQDMNVTIRESNAYGPDLHIPIHTNAGGGQGPLVMVYDDKPVSMAAAQPIYDAVHAVTPGKYGYGIRVRKDLAELSGTKATAVYIECEFHDRPDLAQWIVDNVVPLGEAIARGVCKYFGIEYKAETPPVPAPAPSPAVKYQVGDMVTVSSYYAASTDPISKAVIPSKWVTAAITRINPGSHNPYLVGDYGWCNDGDIRSKGAAQSAPCVIRVGGRVKITGDKYANGVSIPAWVKRQIHIVSKISGDRVLLGADGGINSWVPRKDVAAV